MDGAVLRQPGVAEAIAIYERLVLFLVVLGLNLLLLLNYWLGLFGRCCRMGIVPALRHSQPVLRQP
jgi:hypothetical protein